MLKHEEEDLEDLDAKPQRLLRVLTWVYILWVHMFTIKRGRKSEYELRTEHPDALLSRHAESKTFTMSNAFCAKLSSGTRTLIPEYCTLPTSDNLQSSD